ncbi:tol-pal system-associated acyl-CoA thioesterase [uncultured Thiothrix sp.]|uniref:tol-pal system-associated acyl-CoA thioesterase n=1 Tax=uncultured Thiothrix sp. TaxID=223185 RepID=UPI00262175A6|nr:tol-pal system-associated acyl-CoA thioesterase [uncultured Thiothrix sp.]
MKTETPENLHGFTLPVRVYYEDTDAGRVVYHSNYINFMERARTEWLRSLGYEQDTLIHEQGIVFVVRSLQVDYLKPALFNDLLQVEAAIHELGRTSVHFRQNIWRENKRENTREHLIAGIVRVVCVDAESFRPKPIPAEIRGKFSGEH